MARMGMDPVAVEQTGRELKAQAAALSSTLTQLDRLVGGLPSNWEGADASQFNGSTWPPIRRKMQAACQDTQHLGDELLKQAAEQRGASSTNGGGMAAAGGGSAVGLVPGVTPAQSAGDPALTEAWDRVLGHEIAGNEMRDLLSLAPGSSLLGYTDRMVELDQAFRSGEGRAAAVTNLALDATTDVLKKTGPLGYGAAVGIGSARLAIDVAVNDIDWSPEATASTWNYIRDDPFGALYGAGEGILSSGAEIANIFKWW